MTNTAEIIQKVYELKNEISKLHPDAKINSISLNIPAYEYFKFEFSKDPSNWYYPPLGKEFEIIGIKIMKELK